MSQKPIRTFDEFWSHYVRAHASKQNRMLHFAGTSAAMAIVAAAVLGRRPRLLALAPLVGYGAAWVGHFVVEGNTPASFGHPLWSLASDFVMWSKIVRGTMDAEVERVMASADNGDGAANQVNDERVNVPYGSTVPNRDALN